MKFHYCSTCQRQGLRHCAHPQECGGMREVIDEDMEDDLVYFLSNAKHPEIFLNNLLHLPELSNETKNKLKQHYFNFIQ